MGGEWEEREGKGGKTRDLPEGLPPRRAWSLARAAGSKAESDMVCWNGVGENRQLLSLFLLPLTFNHLVLPLLNL
jgi:hypothetical protein